ncbi:NVEALA domain-containing protein [Bacteroides cellulosilyticus]|jgi:hypothetical protein|uniref:NVEALA domain-containing protein n=3 Tax=Bacteroides cellulosilyticus TaxID=246787 RepID=A0A6A1IR83_9BACE|nr:MULTISPECIES: NVEALA domain-containing protein [Bacteroides]KAA5416072.1 hypothetical protein F2Y87_19535 [Bacteroides cellulosilyticus]KAA5425322.1 hypothetical protein F2Y70_14595 [Bacteroides cellulosilyticus]KAA5431903.1 hypothetical protein F2Y83_21075 [Bacteroides cellulosilyticus]KAA5435564.1 hypothetical protein F2Y74_15720 [Bacteroides cellulosilyticus]KAA5457280.1 hypothetical protein F2Y53_08805 [Bacteroides cellulosilyticus]
MKKFMKIAFVAAFAAIAGYGVYANQKVDTMSDLALANMEALASSGETTSYYRLFPCYSHLSQNECKLSTDNNRPVCYVFSYCQ